MNYFLLFFVFFTFNQSLSSAENNTEKLSLKSILQDNIITFVNQIDQNNTSYTTPISDIKRYRTIFNEILYYKFKRSFGLTSKIPHKTKNFFEELSLKIDNSLLPLLLPIHDLSFLKPSGNQVTLPVEIKESEKLKTVFITQKAQYKDVKAELEKLQNQENEVNSYSFFMPKNQVLQLKKINKKFPNLFKKYDCFISNQEDIRIPNHIVSLNINIQPSKHKYAPKIKEKMITLYLYTDFIGQTHCIVSCNMSVNQLTVEDINNKDNKIQEIIIENVQKHYPTLQTIFLKFSCFDSNYDRNAPACLLNSCKDYIEQQKCDGKNGHQIILTSIGSDKINPLFLAQKDQFSCIRYNEGHNNIITYQVTDLNNTHYFAQFILDWFKGGKKMNLLVRILQNRSPEKLKEFLLLFEQKHVSTAFEQFLTNISSPFLQNELIIQYYYNKLTNEAATSSVWRCPDFYINFFLDSIKHFNSEQICNGVKTILVYQSSSSDKTQQRFFTDIAEIIYLAYCNEDQDNNLVKLLWSKGSAEPKAIIIANVLEKIYKKYHPNLLPFILSALTWHKNNAHFYETTYFEPGSISTKIRCLSWPLVIEHFALMDNEQQKIVLETLSFWDKNPCISPDQRRTFLSQILTSSLRNDLFFYGFICIKHQYENDQKRIENFFEHYIVNDLTKSSIEEKIHFYQKISGHKELHNIIFGFSSHENFIVLEQTTENILYEIFSHPASNQKQEQDIKNIIKSYIQTRLNRYKDHENGFFSDTFCTLLLLPTGQEALDILVELIGHNYPLLEALSKEFYKAIKSSTLSDDRISLEKLFLLPLRSKKDLEECQDKSLEDINEKRVLCFLKEFIGDDSYTLPLQRVLETERDFLRLLKYAYNELIAEKANKYALATLCISFDRIANNERERLFNEIITRVKIDKSATFFSLFVQLCTIWNTIDKKEQKTVDIFSAFINNVVSIPSSSSLCFDYILSNSSILKECLACEQSIIPKAIYETCALNNTLFINLCKTSRLDLFISYCISTPEVVNHLEYLNKIIQLYFYSNGSNRSQQERDLLSNKVKIIEAAIAHYLC